MADYVFVDGFATRAAIATGYMTGYDENIVTIYCPAGTEQKTLELLKEKSGLKEEDYTLLPDKN